MTQWFVGLGLILLFFLASYCGPPPVNYRLLELGPTAYGTTPILAEATPRRSRYRYENWRYLPDTLHPEYTPRRELLVSFHFMNTTDTFYRLYEDRAVAERYLRSLLRSANQNLKENRAYTLAKAGDSTAAVYPVNVNIKLAKKPGTDSAAIYHHYDDELYYFIFRGANRNLGDRRVVKKYGRDTRRVLNIFVMPPHVDSLSSPRFKPNDGVGVYLGEAIKLSGFFPERVNPWQHRGNFNHEVGHALGLRHAWLKNDGCDDTRPHPNSCWHPSQSAYCDTMFSNNVMDYNFSQTAWTPCQIGRIQARLSDPESNQRGWLRPSWCLPYEDKKIVIDQPGIRWEGARDFRKDIVIRPGGSLYINCRVHLARGQTITVEPGGRLDLGPSARLHNVCGHEWGGILEGVAGSRSASVSIDPAAVIENVAP